MTEKKKTGYLKAVRFELKKVVWPTKQEILHYTVLVLGITIVVALACWILDLIFGTVIGWII